METNQDSTPKQLTLEEKKAKYIELCHAMQTGVAFSMNFLEETTPKHLRVGVNSAMVNDFALVRLLMDKGLFTEDEYFDYLEV